MMTKTTTLKWTAAAVAATLASAAWATAEKADDRGLGEVVRDVVQAGNVSLPRMPSISPDGSSVVFSWRGSLWKVDADGGRATPLTAGQFNESGSRWSPDGTRIAFTSDRRGSNGLFVMNADGTGIREVLVVDRAALVSDFVDTPSGEDLLFTGFVEPDVYRSPRPFRVSADGGVHERVHDAFGRNPVLEPGGDRMLFVRGDNPWTRRHYRGPDARDVWLYDPSADADDAFRQLTTWDGNDGDPRWAGADAFVYMSDREGDTVNLFLAELTADDPEADARQLTFFTDRDVDAFDVTPDGGRVVFHKWDGLYTLDLADATATPQRMTIVAPEDAGDNVSYVQIDSRVNEAAVSPNGKAMAFIAYGQLYVRGTEEQASSRRVGDSLARFKNVAWSPDGGTLYFTSDETGRDAVYAATVARTRSELRRAVEAAQNPTTQPATQPTTQPADAAVPHAPDPDRWADPLAFHVELVTESEAGDHSPVPAHDGRHLAFTRDVGQLWVLDLESGDERQIYNGWSSAMNAVWSYDHQHLIYVTQDADFNADVWVTRADGTGWRGKGRPVNLTRHPENDYNMSVSFDGRVLTLGSGRGGSTNVYRVYLDPELESLAPAELTEYHRSLTRAVGQWQVPGVPEWAKARGTVSPLVKPVEPETASDDPVEAPAETPEDPDDLSAEPATEADATETDTDASDAPATQPATRPAASGDPAGGLRAALRRFLLDEPSGTGGEGEAPAARRQGRPAAPAADAGPPFMPARSLDEYDLESAYLRLNPYASGTPGALLLPDASAVYYSNAQGLFRRNWNGPPQRVGDPVSLAGITPKGERIFYTAGGRGGWFDTSGPRAHQRNDRNPSDRLEVELAEMNARKFTELARVLGAQFYHPTMKGLDWDALTQQYLPLARAARTGEEFSFVSSKLLGELNASHMGVTPPSDGPRPARQTAGHLGVRTVPHADGYEVVHVLETGPAGRGVMRLEAGDVITAIDFEKTKTDRPLETHLNDTPGREVVVSVDRNGQSRDLLLTPVAYGAFNTLSYEAWRLDNARRVDELSGGRLGYIHIQGMDQDSLDVFVRDLYAAAEGRDGLLIDVRNNGGGWTTDRLLASIMYPRHAYTIPRGMAESADAHRADPQGGGYPNDRLFIPRYDLPINMLCNEKSFSNAEIVSHAFKTLGRGTLVGETTAGGVISTGAFTLVDGTRVRLPFRGWYLPDGTDMENHGAVPDVRVPQTPVAEARGDDEQLAAAVDDLLSRLPPRDPTRDEQRPPVPPADVTATPPEGATADPAPTDPAPAPAPVVDVFE